MSDIYDDFREIADDLLGEFKQGVINLVQLTPGTGLADNPGEATETVIPLDGVAKGVSFKYVSNGFATASDLIVTCAVKDGVTPSARDFITIDGSRYKIVRDISVPAAGTKVAWKFIVRKGG